MTERTAGAPAVFLLPGEVFTADKAVLVKTVVGSCLAITIRAPQLGISAIAHCVLPEAGVSLDALGAEEAPRYVDTAIELMLRVLTGWGAALRDLEIKIIGGADSMPSGYRVGGRNVAAARGVLTARGLTTAASVVGGVRGRALEFDTGTGDVFVRTLPGHSANYPVVPL